MVRNQKSKQVYQQWLGLVNTQNPLILGCTVGYP